MQESPHECRHRDEIVFSTIAPTFEQLLTQRNASGARKVNRLVRQTCWRNRISQLPFLTIVAGSKFHA